MSLMDRLKSRVKVLLEASGVYFQSATVEQILLRQEIDSLRERMRAATPDNPALAGHKVYSQTDEDGILREIFRRIGAGGRTFVEIGCGNGTENNTHALLLDGWRGTWLDGNPAHIAHIARWIPLETPPLEVRCTMVTRDNAPELVASSMHRVGARELDLLSVDIDGNDLYVLQRILGTAKPRVIVAEYNGKFPPPLSVSIAYDPAHAWAVDDYFGASLQALVDGLAGYRLVACNVSGTNAFFVREDQAGPFARHTAEALYQPGRPHLIKVRYGPAATLKFLRDAIKEKGPRV